MIRPSPGLLVHYTGNNGFKVAVVLGTFPSGKVRVCLWSALSKHWSQPQSRDPYELQPLDNLKSAHSRVVAAAMKDLLDSRGSDGRMEVRFKGGARAIPKATTNPPARRSHHPVEGVTKLTSPLQTLNGGPK